MEAWRCNHACHAACNWNCRNCCRRFIETIRLSAAVRVLLTAPHPLGGLVLRSPRATRRLRGLRVLGRYAPCRTCLHVSVLRRPLQRRHPAVSTRGAPADLWSSPSGTATRAGKQLFGYAGQSCGVSSGAASPQSCPPLLRRGKSCLPARCASGCRLRPPGSERT